MRPYGTAHLLASFDWPGAPPAPDPLEVRIQAALDQGADITPVLAILDADDDDREPEETDGGSLYPEDTGLAVNETIGIYSECRCCGTMHRCEEIFVA